MDCRCLNTHSRFSVVWSTTLFFVNLSLPRGYSLWWKARPGNVVGGNGIPRGHYHVYGHCGVHPVDERSLAVRLLIHLLE